MIFWNFWLIEKTFCTERVPTLRHWQMGHGHISCLGVLDRVKIFDSPQELTDQIWIRWFDANWNVWWCGIEPGDQGESEGTSPAEFWPSEHHRWRIWAAVLASDRCYDEPGHKSKKREACEFGKLTKNILSSSERSGKVGIDDNLTMNCGQRQKGIAKIRWLRKK
jgi:hypothetical protein